MRNDNRIQTLQCLIQVHSPVHVGCDEVYEPTGFLMDREKNQLVVFDPTGFIADLPEEDRAEFSSICKKGTVVSILEIYRFLQNRQADGRRVEVCNGFSRHLDKVLDLPLKDERRIQQELNNFKIERTAFNPNDGRPYIPGSAIKGSIRTAWLNHVSAKEVGLRTPMKRDWKGRMQPDAHELEKTLLKIRNKLIEEDPFRLIKVSDFHPVESAPTRVSYAVNLKKEKGGEEGRDLYQILEIIQPGAVFRGSINVEQPHPHPKAPINQTITATALLNSLDFFIDEKRRENRELSGIGVSPFEVEISNGSRLIRIGRHSGAESLTVKGHRRIAIRVGGNNYKISEKGATTLWLAAESSKPAAEKNLKPFGWVTLEQLSIEAIGKLEEIEKAWRKEREIELAERLDRQRMEKERLIEEARLREEAEARAIEEQRLREEAEADLKAKREAMTPAQREAAELMQPGVHESKAWEACGRLEIYEGEDQLALARALKEYFLSRNKWTKKQCSSKQWKKIREIRAILCEN